MEQSGNDNGGQSGPGKFDHLNLDLKTIIEQENQNKRQKINDKFEKGRQHQ